MLFNEKSMLHMLNRYLGIKCYYMANNTDYKNGIESQFII